MTENNLSTYIAGKLNYIDNIFLFLFCLIHMLSEVLFIFVLWNGDYMPQNAYFFKIFFSITSSMPIGLGFILMYRIFSHDMFYIVSTLFLSALIQVVDVIADVVYIVFFDGLWEDGYVYFILEIIFILIYIKRYYILNQFKEIFVLNFEQLQDFGEDYESKQ